MNEPNRAFFQKNNLSKMYRGLFTSQFKIECSGKAHSAAALHDSADSCLETVSCQWSVLLSFRVQRHTNTRTESVASPLLLVSSHERSHIPVNCHVTTTSYTTTSYTCLRQQFLDVWKQLGLSWLLCHTLSAKSCTK